MTLEKTLYTDLLIKCISNSIYKDDLRLLYKRLSNELSPMSDDARATGADWPSKAHSMVGLARLSNLRDLTQRAIDDAIPGDFIETGVWRGGCCILMRGVLAINGVVDRKVFVCDSFEGLPKPNAREFPQDVGHDLSGYEELAVPLSEVKANFESYDLLDKQVEFVKGFFSETLRGIKAEHFALIRLDGDLYESTYVALDHLYPKLSQRGFVIIDDYNAFPPCKRAVDDYRVRFGITCQIRDIDGAGIWWQKL